MSTPLNLPAPLTDDEMDYFLTHHKFPRHDAETYIDQKSKSIPDLLRNQYDPYAIAMVRRLDETDMDSTRLIHAILSSMGAPERSVALANVLLLAEYFHNAGYSSDELSNIIGNAPALYYNNGPRGGLVTPITTTDELLGFAAVAIFTEELKGTDHCKRYYINGGEFNWNGVYTVIVSRPLDRLLRSQPDMLQPALTFLKDRPLGRYKRDLEPLIEYAASQIHSAIGEGWL